MEKPRKKGNATLSRSELTVAPFLLQDAMPATLQSYLNFTLDIPNRTSDGQPPTLFYLMEQFFDVSRVAKREPKKDDKGHCSHR